MNTSFLNTESIISKAMSAESLRLKVISDNIANADTPKFKRSAVTFESELRRALQGNSNIPFDAKLTNKKHIPFDIPKDLSSVNPRIHLEYNTDFLNNENNVDVEQEMVNLEKTQLRYQVYSSYLGRNYRLLSSLFTI
jgi:flagellar basal-body rod protein FlgB